MGTASLVHGLNEGGKENENWRMLGRVLKDPYLERASLEAGRLIIARKGEERESWDLGSCKDLTWLLGNPVFDQDGTCIKGYLNQLL